MHRKFISLLPIALTLMMITSCHNGTGSQEADTEEEEEVIPPIGFWESDYIKETISVKRGETLPIILRKIGLPTDSVSIMLLRLDTLFNPRRMRIGQKVDAYYSGDSLNRKLEYAVYNHSRTKATVFKCSDSLYLWNYYRPVEHIQKTANVVINNSLWADLTAEGAPVEIVTSLADIYAWTVNFFALKKGDKFDVVYTIRECEGENIGVDKVDFCRYSRGSEQICAIFFDGQDGTDKYFTQNGENLRKAFLKAPLRYNRVSSKFSMRRKHPVTGQVRPHTGVDYAAPLGTPVVALGDGTVISAGWTNNGGGNVIKIKHNSTYTTGYLHLKGYATGIKKGAKVKQGQIIGYVGSTGRSTGPHLDFRVWKNGTPIDPLSMKSPAADPLPAKYKPQLDSLYEHYTAILSER